MLSDMKSLYTPCSKTKHVDIHRFVHPYTQIHGAAQLPFTRCPSAHWRLARNADKVMISLSRIVIASAPAILYINVQGMMQHWQSSPHQHGNLTGGFAIGPFAIDGADVPELVADVVEGGMVAGASCSSEGYRCEVTRSGLAPKVSM